MTRQGPVDLNDEFVRSLPDAGQSSWSTSYGSVNSLATVTAAAGTRTRRYSKADIPLLKRVGGTILWAGHVEGTAVGDLGAGRWDWVVVVWYPSRAAFMAMMTSPEYAIANIDRENAIEDHVILAANESYSKLRPGA